MSINRRLTFSRLTPRRLLLAAGLAATCACSVAGPASAASNTPHTVLNYCSNRAGLGTVYRGVSPQGLGYLEWDGNGDGKIDHIAVDTNGDQHVDLVLSDTNADGTPDLVGLCNGQPQAWYQWSTIVARVQQSQQQEYTQPQAPNAAANEAWGEMMPGLSVLYGINPIGPDLYTFDY